MALRQKQSLTREDLRAKARDADFDEQFDTYLSGADSFEVTTSERLTHKQLEKDVEYFLHTNEQLKSQIFNDPHNDRSDSIVKTFIATTIERQTDRLNGQVVYNYFYKPADRVLTARDFGMSPFDRQGEQDAVSTDADKKPDIEEFERQVIPIIKRIQESIGSAHQQKSNGGGYNARSCAIYAKRTKSFTCSCASAQSIYTSALSWSKNGTAVWLTHFRPATRLQTA
jgi:hypothetical protein